MEEYDVLAVGDLNVDVVVVPAGKARAGREVLADSGAVALGGSAALFAAASARLGLRVALVAVVGADPAGRLLRDFLRLAGVDTSHLVETDEPTGVTVSLAVGGDRALITYRGGTVGSLKAHHVPDALLRSARHVHVSSYFLHGGLGGQLAALLARCRDLGLTVSLDPGDDPAGKFDGGLRGLCRGGVLDFLLVNAREAQRLAGCRSPLRAALLLGASGSAVAVKMGRDGALLHVPAGGAHGSLTGWAGSGTNIWKIRAPAVAVRDTTGAGDNFDAGLVAGFLAGYGPVESLRLATACGAMATTVLGGVGPFLCREEAMAFMRERVSEPQEVRHLGLRG